MKRNYAFVALIFALVLSLPLVGCSQAAPTSTPGSSLLDESYTDALSARNQLLLGTVALEDTAQAISADQAKQLLPLWQGLLILTGSGTTAQEEIDALLKQIESTYSPAQLQAIGEMRLTRVELQTTLSELGIAVTSGTGTGTGVGQGQGRNMSDADRAAREAARAAAGGTPTGGMGSNGGGANTALLDYVINILTAKSR